MDLFGKQAQQELAQLQAKFNSLELRYIDLWAEFKRIEAINASINDANESIAHYEAVNREVLSKTLSLMEEHRQKNVAINSAFKQKESEIKIREEILEKDHKQKKEDFEAELKKLQLKAETAILQHDVAKKSTNILQAKLIAGEKQYEFNVSELLRLNAALQQTETELCTVLNNQSNLSGAVAKLTRQQEALAGSNLYLNQIVSRLNRRGDEDTVFASLEHDLHRFLTHDRTSGAMQVTLKARPLLLVVDLGNDALNFAVVRAGLLSGDSEISLCVESRQIVKNIGGGRIEAVFAAWLWERVTAVHPRLNKSVKQQMGVEFAIPMAQRLLALLCQDAPQGEVEETIVIDSEPFNFSMPLLREELVSIFLPLLGQDGDLMGAVRRFLAEYKLSVEAIDRVVCMGWYGRLPLLRESLDETFKRPVLFAESLVTVAPTESQEPQGGSQKKKIDDNPNVRVTVVNSVSGEGNREKAEGNDHAQLQIGSCPKCGTKNRLPLDRDESQKHCGSCHEPLLLKQGSTSKKLNNKKEDEYKALEFGFTCPVTGMEFVFVKGGTFQMGSMNDGKYAQKLVHEVKVSDFLIGKYLITEGEWKKYFYNKEFEFSNSDRHPKVYVSWDYVQKFIEKLFLMTGRNFRLPTEAEWEYAARSGGKNEKWAGTSDEMSVGEYCWNSENASSTMQIGLKRPNGLGIYDMSGNVWEYCHDYWHDGNYFMSSPLNNPTGPTDGSHKVTRGGSFRNNEKLTQVSVRGAIEPNSQHEHNGFRLVISFP